MKQYQEVEVEFRRDADADIAYPVVRGIVVYAYGGDLEEVTRKARKQLRLGTEWRVVRAEE